MDKDYIFSTLFATMTCTTVALGANLSYPEYNSICPVETSAIPSGEHSYVLSNSTPSYVHIPQTREEMDFNILVSFGMKLLNDEAPIDEDIQQVINDNFWDML